jgi:hypothetical protein
VLLSLCVLLTAYLLVYVFYTETSGMMFGAYTEEFLWRTLPLPLTVGLTAVLTAWVLYDVYRGKDASAVFTYAVYLCAVLLVYFSFLYLHMTDVYHGIAYTESIYNAVHGVPYTRITTGIYGHYGIFFGLILRIFNGNAVMMAHLIALSGALAAVACCYCVHSLTKRNALRVIGVLCAVFTTIVLREHNYWQLQPHRVLIPLLTVAYLCYMAKGGRYGVKHLALGFVLTGVGIVWNTESGLFATAAFMLGVVAHDWQTKKPFARSMWLRYAALIGGAVGALAGAILLVNLYNLCCGGPFILKDFFFPVFEGSYMNGFLKIGPPYGVQAWILVLILFFGVLLYGVWHTRALRDGEGDRDPFAPRGGGTGLGVPDAVQLLRQPRGLFQSGYMLSAGGAVHGADGGPLPGGLARDPHPRAFSRQGLHRNAFSFLRGGYDGAGRTGPLGVRYDGKAGAKRPMGRGGAERGGGTAGRAGPRGLLAHRSWLLHAESAAGPRLKGVLPRRQRSVRRRYGGGRADGGGRPRSRQGGLLSARRHRPRDGDQYSFRR